MLELITDGAILRVWMDRPQSLNALDDETLTELADVFSTAQQRFDVKAIVLGGRGRSFSAGADLKKPPGLRGVGERERRWHSQVGYRACQAIADCEVVTIARLNGHVLGGGFALALACDFRVAADDARFALPEIDLGIPLTWGAVPRLITEIGAARAREMVMLCNTIDAAQAHRVGLVHRCSSAGELDAVVDELAAQLAGKPEYAMHVSKTQFRAYTNAVGDPTFSDGDMFRAGISAATAQPRRPGDS